MAEQAFDDQGNLVRFNRDLKGAVIVKCDGGCKNSIHCKCKQIGLCWWCLWLPCYYCHHPTTFKVDDPHDTEKRVGYCKWCRKLHKS